MGCILYKLSNLHTWEQRLEGGRGRDKIHNCEAREKDRNGREGTRGEGTAVYPSSHREKSGNFTLRDMCESRKRDSTSCPGI